MRRFSNLPVTGDARFMTPNPWEFFTSDTDTARTSTPSLAAAAEIKIIPYNTHALYHHQVTLYGKQYPVTGYIYKGLNIACCINACGCLWTQLHNSSTLSRSFTMVWTLPFRKQWENVDQEPGGVTSTSQYTSDNHFVRLRLSLFFLLSCTETRLQIQVSHSSTET